MIRSFRAVVLLAVVAPAVAVAQYPAGVYAQPGPCPGGVCPRVTAAVQEVRAVVGQVIQPAGGVVQGVYADGSRCNLPAVRSVPQRMPARWYPGQRVIQLFR